MTDHVQHIVVDGELYRINGRRIQKTNTPNPKEKDWRNVTSTAMHNKLRGLAVKQRLRRKTREKLSPNPPFIIEVNDQRVTMPEPSK